MANYNTMLPLGLAKEDYYPRNFLPPQVLPTETCGGSITILS
ncbi:MAG: hypothetical protein JWR50_201 [Mucilaginibacter sp.]|nr:hypothetical protein [Mucilaginibacter sp.]